MKKKTVYNIIMVAVIAAIAAVAVLLAGRHLGWFDKAAPEGEATAIDVYKRQGQARRKNRGGGDLSRQGAAYGRRRPRQGNEHPRQNPQNQQPGNAQMCIRDRRYSPMSDEFGPNFITITDEDGNDIELEYVDALEHNGVTYMAFFPTADTEEEAESAQDFGLVILKSVMENGEELLATPDTDEELNEVFDLFTQQLLEDEE